MVKKFIDPAKEALGYLSDERWEACTRFCNQGRFREAVNLTVDIRKSYSKQCFIMAEQICANNNPQ